MHREKPAYGEALIEALTLAAEAFRDRHRKGTSIPYLTHLMQVMTWVGEYGGDEDQMIAALLHDYLEDIEGSSEAELHARFGPRVCGYVVALSDGRAGEKGPWRVRKTRYLAHLRQCPVEVRLIACADKLHNATCIVRDLKTDGEALWERFSAPKHDCLWYYRSVFEALSEGWNHDLLAQLQAQVEAMHALADTPLPETWPG